MPGPFQEEGNSITDPIHGHMRWTREGGPVEDLGVLPREDAAVSLTRIPESNAELRRRKGGDQSLLGVRSNTSVG